MPLKDHYTVSENILSALSSLTPLIFLQIVVFDRILDLGCLFAAPCRHMCTACNVCWYQKRASALCGAKYLGWEEEFLGYRYTKPPTASTMLIRLISNLPSSWLLLIFFLACYPSQTTRHTLLEEVVFTSCVCSCSFIFSSFPQVLWSGTSIATGTTHGCLVIVVGTVVGWYWLSLYLLL